MKHTIVTIGKDSEHSVKTVSGQKELTEFLDEVCIQRHQNDKIFAQCGHQDIYGNTVYIIRGERQLVQFKPFIPIRKSQFEEDES